MVNANAINKPASASAAKRKAQIGVLVLGMPGGGGSMLTKVLNVLGCALPITPLGPSEDDDDGYLQASSTAILSDEILASAGSSWNDWGPINSDWSASGVRAEMVERAAEVIGEHRSLGPLFAMEEPRLCRLADLWLEAALTVNVDMRVVLMMRHPDEVAATLEARDLMVPGYGLLLWLRHTLDAEFFTRGCKRAVCRFDQLLHGWQDTINALRRNLNLALPRNSLAAHDEVDRLLAREIGHLNSRADAGVGQLDASDWIRRTFDILSAWADRGESEADHAELDRIRHEFDAAYPAFARLLLSSDLAGHLASGKRLRDELRDQLALVSDRANEIEQQVAEVERLRIRDEELTRHIAVLTDTHEALKARAEALGADVEKLRDTASQATELGAQIESLRDRETEMADEVRSIAEARDLAESALEALKSEIESLKVSAERASTLEGEVVRLGASEDKLASQAAELEAKLVAAYSERDAERSLRADADRERDERGIVLEQQKRLNVELEERVRTANSAIQQRVEELERVLAELNSIEEAAAAATGEAKDERERRADAEAQLAAALQDLRDVAERKSELEGRLSAAESAAVQRKEEVAQLWSQLEALQTTAGASAAEVAAERERRADAEAQLAAALQDARAIAELKGQLEGRTLTAESALVAAEKAAAQRQEEVAQLWNQLGVVQNAAGASLAEMTLERERRTEAEAQLATALQDARAFAEIKGHLESRLLDAEGALSAAEKAAAQRQEEVAQLWDQLGVVQNAAGASLAEVTLERERRTEAEAQLATAWSDMRRMVSEKADIEVRARTAEMALGSQQDENLRLSEQVADAKEASRRHAAEASQERALRCDTEAALTSAQSSLAELRTRLAALEHAPAFDPQPLHSEIAQLTRMLEAQEADASSVEAARQAADQRLTEQNRELARLTARLAEVGSRAEESSGHADWLREFARVSEGLPKWWSLMPQGWRRKREHQIYRRAGVFDAEQYLQLYPDVSAVGMDPIRHYVLHGMFEGRTLCR